MKKIISAFLIVIFAISFAHAGVMHGGVFGIDVYDPEFRTETVGTSYRGNTRAGIDAAIAAGAKSVELVGNITLAAHWDLSAYTGRFSTNGHQISGAYTFTAPANFVGSIGCFGSALTVTGLSISYVDWFTGVPDGTTDNSAGIAAAIAAMPRVSSASGRHAKLKVIFSSYEKPFYSESDITLTTATGLANPELILEGPGSIKFGTTKGFVVDSNGYLTFNELTIIGSGTDGQTAIYMHDMNGGINVRRCFFVAIKGANSVCIFGTASYLVRIIECVFHSTCIGSTGIFFTSGEGNCSKGTAYAHNQDIRIEQCTIQSSGVGVKFGDYTNRGAIGFHVNGASITDCDFEKNATCIALENTQNVLISGCYLEGAVGVANKGVTIDGYFAYGTKIESVLFNPNASNFDPAISIANAIIAALSIDSCSFRFCAKSIVSTTTTLKDISINNCLGVTGSLEPVFTNNTMVSAFGNLSTGVKTYPSAFTDDGNMVYFSSGNWITNSGAIKDIVLTLPSAVVGKEFHFVVTAAQYIRLVPVAGQQIRGTSAAGKYAEASGLGTIVHLRCFTANMWELEYTGTVILEP